MNDSPGTRGRTAEKVVIEGCKLQGLGIRIVGGRNITLADGEMSDFGIFIKEVIDGRLAKRDGRLRKGDQLLEANGNSLVGVSNSSAVSILKEAAATDCIVLLVSRDSQSQSDFKRLSSDIVKTATPHQNGDPGSQEFPVPPIASSTPLHPPLTTEPRDDIITASTATTKPDRANQRHSSSSELTNITTTDISSHGDDDDEGEGEGEGEEEEGEEDDKVQRSLPGERGFSHDSGYSPGLESLKPADRPVALSDVVVSVPSPINIPPLPSMDPPLTINGHPESDEDAPPPPPPSSLPPTENDREGGDEVMSSEDHLFPAAAPPPIPTSPMPDDDEELILPPKKQPTQAEVPSQADTILGRCTPEGKSVSSPPPSSPFPTSPTSPLPRHTLTIPKGVMGLGLHVEGGIRQPNGPHIVIGKIIDGSDAARDGRLEVGDRILSVNGESFVGITRERALTILTQLRGRSTVKSYTIEYERPVVISDPNDGDSPFESPPCTLPSRNGTSDSVFDSDTLPISSVTQATTSSEIPASAGGDPVPSLLSAGSARLGETRAVPRRYMARKEQDKGKHDSVSKRLSMDPTARVALSKLELALKFMGHTLTPEQKETVHTKLDVDANGKVIFSEFVRLAQDMFAFKMESSRLEAGLVLALTQKETMDLPPYPRKAGSVEVLSYTPHSPAKLSASHPHISNITPPMPLPPSQDTPTLLEKEVEIRRHREQLLKFGQKQEERRKESTGDSSYLGTVSDTFLMREAGLTKPLGGILSRQHYTGEELSELSETQALRKKVGLLETALQDKERELESLQQVAPGSLREAQLLRRQIMQHEENLAQKELRCMQLEETLRHMEGELAGLRRRPSEEHMPPIDLQRRLATLDCQLRKEQAITRRFQVTTEKLMQFVETCHEALVKSPEASKILYHRHGKGEAVQRGDTVTGNPRPPPYLAKHAKVTSVTLAQEAHDTMLAVHKMLQIKNLPYGWEEAFTEEGEKYYMNHETQTTAWVHPVTHVSAVPSSLSSTPSMGSRRSSQSSSHLSLTPPPSPRASIDTT